MRLIALSTAILFIFMEGITVYPALKISNALVKQTNEVEFED